jgi:Sulfatase
MKWTDPIAALSLANLVYLRLWAELLAMGPTTVYWLKAPPRPEHFIALMINVVLLSLLILAGIVGLRSKRTWARRATPLVGLAILVSLVNSLRTLVGNPGNSLFLKFVEQRAPAIGVALAILIILALVFGGLKALRPVYRLLLLVSPFVVFSFGQAAYRIANYDPSPMADGVTASRLPDKPAGSPRVVWIIFDEWDYELSYVQHPSRIALPELDRLSETSLFGANVQSANMMTDWSMPALTMGREVQDITPSTPSELMIHPKDSADWVPWSHQETVFRKAREMGFNTSIVGWAIPYCRVLNHDLSECWWYSGSNQYNSAGDTVPKLLLGQPRSLYENIYRSPFGQSLSTSRHARSYHTVMAKAVEAACNTANGLTLIHLPVPHPPYFYSAATGRDDLNDTLFTGLPRQTQQGYVDALALTARSIGELRGAMERAGVWDSTTIVFSADHPFRHRVNLDGQPVSHRVPYLVKMAGQNGAIKYEPSFSALLTKGLILAVLSGDVARPEQLPAWLDQHRNQFSNPAP